MTRVSGLDKLILALIIIGAMWATKKLDRTAQED